MIAEVGLMFLLAFLQGFGGIGSIAFELDRWVLVSIEAGVLLQTFALARIITKALFPDRERERTSNQK